jgi:glycosyltransferase involved in cell wall biosynthesis
MKMLQIIPSVSLVYGGPSQMILGLSKALANNGIELTIITTNSNGDQGQAPLNVPLKTPIKQDGYEIIYFQCSPFKRYKFSFDLLMWLNSNINNYDLAHIHALFSPVTTAAATICRMKNVPYILRPLGTLDPADLKKKKQLKNIYGYLLEKPNISGAAGIHFTSQKECDVSFRFGAKTNDLIIPLGVEIAENLSLFNNIRQELGINDNIPLILFMSRIEPKKGLDLLIPALEILLNEGLNFHFILAGANPQDQIYEDSIKEQINHSSLKKSTTITGFVTGENKLKLLQNADLFVLPSYYENFGIAVVEAMLMGIPVVISDQVYIYQEIEKAKAGWICNCNKEDLIEKLRLAIIDHNSRKEKGLNARKLVEEKYNWNAIAHQMISIYEEIISLEFSST